MGQLQDLAAQYPTYVWDVYTRAIRGWHLSRSLDRELTLTALRRALAERLPLIHHSDQGVQYACWDYTDSVGVR